MSNFVYIKIYHEFINVQLKQERSTVIWMLKMNNISIDYKKKDDHDLSPHLRRTFSDGQREDAISNRKLK